MNRTTRLGKLYTELQECTLELEHVNSELLRDNDTKAQIQHSMKVIENQVEYEVQHEIDPDSEPEKPKMLYTNDAARRNAAFRKLNEHEAYQEAREVERKLTARISDWQNKHELIKERRRILTTLIETLIAVPDINTEIAKIEATRDSTKKVLANTQETSHSPTQTVEPEQEN